MKMVLGCLKEADLAAYMRNKHRCPRSVLYSY